MKGKYTIHHYFWLACFAVTVILALCKNSFWYVPIVFYFVVEILAVFVLATFKGKIKKLPKLAKKAAIKAAKKTKSTYTIRHYICFTVIALTVILARCENPFWYVPIALYVFIRITVGIFAVFAAKR